MRNLLANLKISVPDQIYVKDPESSALGKRIIQHSIHLLDNIGFEAFTFKKLGTAIGSNESSIYRYFENKHKLLLYLSSWYWAWLEYQVVIETYSIQDKKEKLEKAIFILCRTTEKDSNYSHINEITLNNIIINESYKSFLTKEVDQENKAGYFEIYKRLVARLSTMITEAAPNYIFTYSLASTIIEGSLHQHFLKEHLPKTTTCNEEIHPSCFFTNLTLNTLKL
ncbi:TetR/AcrR family transcriptional regulator [Tamlana haliotis]|uniref:TetR/AcrR family transcriptional regulator n=1 Tax=Pseudotamlana haliotis TaxID=2614804 RepID=A0A6N6MHX5_9FLAO|nr:TetR/AcrR family transcriptional regulator [Tamlana haliotis]KAB1069111.1 TetR/AcrR family transcriptional regulator [Tamlana haliotis]